ncbi:MAG: AEC family transporter [Rhizobiales bacterium]|nr:AEC family transporter [Hyphomicrobiales bacterium]NRB14764.1 AEC family transporter [Hyphomicrobiales bacterium]
MNILIDIVSPFFFLIFLGFSFGKIFSGDDSGLYWLNKFIVYLAVPSLLFSLLSKSAIEEIANFNFIATTTLLTFVVFSVSFTYLVYLRKKRIGDSALYAASSSFSNGGYMGVPLMVALLGDEAIIPATLVLTFDNILHFIIIPLIVGRNDEGSKFSRLMFGLKELIKNPFLIASILGILVSAIDFGTPDLIVSLTDQMGQAAIPTALFSLGLSLALSKFSVLSLDKFLLIFMKLFIHPVLVAVVIISMGIFDPVWTASAIIMASLPTALSVYMMARQYGKDAETVSSITFFGTVVSIGTISLVIFLVDAYILKI